MTQTFETVPQTLSVTPKPFVFTQLGKYYPTSPSDSVIDFLSHASDEIHEDLLPEGTITHAMGTPIVNLGSYLSTISHTQLTVKKNSTSYKCGFKNL